MYQLLQKIRRAVKTPDGAAALSFLFPGLGQAAAGKPSRGAIVAIPALAIVASLLVAILFARKSLFDNAFNDQWLFSLLIVDLVAMAYHIWAIGDAYATARRRKVRSVFPKKWMTVAAVTTANIHFQTDTIGRWARSGRLQTIKLGNRRFVRRAQVRALLRPHGTAHDDDLQPGLFEGLD